MVLFDSTKYLRKEQLMSNTDCFVLVLVCEYWQAEYTEKNMCPEVETLCRKGAASYRAQSRKTYLQKARLRLRACIVLHSGHNGIRFRGSFWVRKSVALPETLRKWYFRKYLQG